MNVITQSKFLIDPDGEVVHVNEPPAGSIIIYRHKTEGICAFQREMDGKWAYPGLGDPFSWDRVKIFVYHADNTIMAVISP